MDWKTLERAVIEKVRSSKGNTTQMFAWLSTHNAKKFSALPADKWQEAYDFLKTLP